MKYLKSAITSKTLMEGLTIDDYCPPKNKLPLDGAIAHINCSFGPKINKIFTELFFVLDGSLEIDIDGKLHKLEKEDIFIMPPDTSHTVIGKNAKVFISCSPSFEQGALEMVK